MDNEEYDLGMGLSIITIVMDESKPSPEIDLDNCPPHIAIIIFAKAIEALEENIPYPTIRYQGKTIFSEIYIPDDEETSD